MGNKFYFTGGRYRDALRTINTEGAKFNMFYATINGYGYGYGQTVNNASIISIFIQ